MEIVNTTFSAFTFSLLGESAEILAKYSSARLSSAFMTGKAVESLALEYFAKISADAPNSKDVNALNVVFTISIV